ncbi:YesN/AraC family two-component response regulator [Paenibacillus phyllosphaerae]|uniref:YesN/AraC family two-component response regulator n=1 Tax=Paenibacillus phyllosphaerae TaxID=274593 RepID=A0A7W5B351_9BACL|nr:helix-turn-helix domain-containing protein [Paenibacillus phyllosphaerae]MBB3113041.1 YesN/AraC family two-component response regulator [Paenibacillus phyllosphaerae]
MNKSVSTSSAARVIGREIAPAELSLAELIRSEQATSEQIRDRLKQLGHHYHYAYPTLALCAVGASEGAVAYPQAHLLEICKALERIAQGGCAVFPDPFGRDIGILFSWDNRSFLERLHEITTLPSHALTLTSSSTLTIGIGNPCQHLHDLHQSLSQAQTALEHKFYAGTRQVIFFSGLKPHTVVDKYPEQQENSLLSLMQEQAAEAIEPAIEAYYEALLERGPLRSNDVKNATLRLLIGLELQMKASSCQRVSAARPDLLSILRMETLQEIKACAAHFIRGLMDTGSSKEGMNSSLIKKALTFMENEYDKATLHYVAEKVFLTPAYLSSLFKNHMGVTFIEHLTEIRISHAKKLLKQTYLKNYEVAEQVGYHDSRYFSQIFKRKVGLSPSEFRDSFQLAN